LYDIDKKTFLTEPTTNFSSELAFWVGMAAAFLFHALFKSFINISATFDLLLSDTVCSILWFILFFAVVNIVAASYVFPVTKESSLFLDLENANFVIPLLRNLVITSVTAAVISYGLSVDLGYVSLVLSAVFGGFLFLFLGFTGARRTDFSHGEEYLVVAPLLWTALFWYPLKVVYSLSGISYEGLSFALSLLSILVLALVIILILMEKGKLLMTKEERIVMIFKKKEFPHTGDFSFVFLVMLMLLMPAVMSLGVCVVSLGFDALRIVPVRNVLMYVSIFILGLYGLKNSDILFFSKISFLVDIISYEHKIREEDCHFIANVIGEYQGSDGGFDYAGVGFSNQKDTFYFLKTAEICKIQLDHEEIAKWVSSTEAKEGGFALFSGGYPRVKGLYYAAQSLSFLNRERDFSQHVQWILASFSSKKGYFEFAYDTDSILLQTCYAVELLASFGATNMIDVDLCRTWIETRFSKDLKPKEAFLAARALQLLNANFAPVKSWLKNNNLSGTRVDKNLEEVYFYVSVLHILNRAVPSLIVEQAVCELAKTRKEYEKRF
jgi:hypothetical protein